MTPKQFFTRLQTDLKALVWEGTANKIFGTSVWVVPEIPIRQLSEWSAPSCFILDQGFVNDGEHPGIGTQNFGITFFVENVQQNMGEGGILSANRVANTSAGAGSLDIEEELIMYFIEKLSLTTKIMIVEKSKPKLQIVANNNPLLLNRWTFRTLLGYY